MTLEPIEESGEVPERWQNQKPITEDGMNEIHNGGVGIPYKQPTNTEEWEDYRYFRCPNVPLTRAFAQTKDGARYELEEINLNALITKTEADTLERVREMVEGMKVCSDAGRADPKFYHCENSYDQALQDLLTSLTENNNLLSLSGTFEFKNLDEEYFRTENNNNL